MAQFEIVKDVANKTSTVANFVNIPSLTQAEINALTGVSVNTMLFNSTIGLFQVYNGVTWETVAYLSDLQSETNPYIFDDFLNTNTTSLNIGQLGWSHTPSAAGSSVSNATSTPNHAGVLSIISPTLAAGTSILHLANSATTGNTAYGNVKDYTVVFMMPIIVGSGFFIGMSQNWTIAPANTMYIRKLSTDTNFQFVNVAGGVSTVTNSGIAPVAGTWYKFKIVPSAANIQYWLNDVLIATVATNIMVSTVMLGAGSLHTGGNRQLLIDCVGINLNQTR
jgi:hypothetical protein